jgi:hypothetical protein
MQDTVTPKGRYRATIANPAKAPKLYEKVLAFLALNLPTEQDQHDHFRELAGLLASFNREAAVHINYADNLVPTAGKTLIAARLSGTTTYTGIVNYVGLGTGTTSPNVADTQLGTEGYRAAPSSSSFAANVANLSLFIAAGTATGTWTEAGLFVDGTASANTGQLMSHVATNIVKGASNSLTIECALTVA